MALPHHLRPFEAGDLAPLLQLYHDAVISQCPGPYSSAQVEAWARQAQHGEAVAAAIRRGWTLVNPVEPHHHALAAFAVLDPVERLSLLYCDGRFARQGRAGALLAAAEAHARHCSVRRLRTEASQLSRPLLLRCGWQIEASETVTIGGVSFERWRMIKTLAD